MKCITVIPPLLRAEVSVGSVITFLWEVDCAHRGHEGAAEQFSTEDNVVKQAEPQMLPTKHKSLLRPAVLVMLVLSSLKCAGAQPPSNSAPAPSNGPSPPPSNSAPTPSNGPSPPPSNSAPTPSQTTNNSTPTASSGSSQTTSNSAPAPATPEATVGPTVDWDCVSAKGQFQRLDDCTLSDTISISESFNLTGRNTLTTITAPASTSTSSKRHFLVKAEGDGQAITFTLKWLKLANGGYSGGTYPSSTWSGGALLIQHSVGSIISLFNCWFHGNIASQGGAIAVDETSVTLSIYDTNFTDNVAGGAGWGGGAMYISAPVSSDDTRTLTMVGGNMINNHAKDADVQNGGRQHGGAVFCSFFDYSFSDMVIKENSAIRGGGMLIIQGTFWCERVIFHNNEATGNNDGGGALYVDDGDIVGTIKNTTFTNNAANEKLATAGALYIAAGNVRMSFSRFRDNEANTPPHDMLAEGTLTALNLDMGDQDSTDRASGPGLEAGCSAGICSKYADFPSYGVGCVERSGNYGFYCSLCTAGKYLPDYNTSSYADCLPCLPGTAVSSVGSAECTTCSNGRYRTLQGGEECEDCARGMYGSMAMTCFEVPPGFYPTSCIDEVALTGCASTAMCELGHYCPGGNATKQACAPGKYANAIGLAACVQCIEGRYAAKNGSHECSKCNEGNYTDLLESTSCSICDTGRSSFEGSAICFNCAAGKFGNSSGLCTWCPADTFSDKEGQKVSCNTCENGKTSLPGSVTCTEEVYGLTFAWPPSQQSVTEGGTLQYTIGLKTVPSSDVVVSISVIGGGCTVSPSAITNAGQVSVSTYTDQNYTHIDTLSYECVLKHTITTADEDYKLMRDSEKTISVLSKGCGVGEYLGAYERKNNGSQCICGRGYFLPPQSECIDCPLDVSICNENGLVAPVVAPGWWRQDPRSPDLEKFNFYKCPFSKACLGGNSSKGRCIGGHDDDGPVCATCAKEYTLQGDTCQYCPGRANANTSSPELLAAFLGVLALFAVGIFFYLTRPALSKEELATLRAQLSVANFQSAGSIQRDDFVEKAGQMCRLSVVQLNQAYDYIDSDNSGDVDMDELRNFLDVPDTEAAARQLQDLEEMVEVEIDDAGLAALELIGGWLMKLKIFVGFAQCFAYFPVTFNIPWPASLLAFMKLMEFSAFDIYAVMGDLACRMQTSFFQKFTYHMILLPAVLVVVLVVYAFSKVCKCRKGYTAESSKTQLLSIVSLLCFSLYTGIATRIFRLYKCRTIQGSKYLTADYTIKCTGVEYENFALVGAVCIVVFVIGIPGSQAVLLYYNRHHLHEIDGMSHTDKVRQYQVEKMYGSIYLHYIPECYYYDILDMTRRLALTGGLIMMGEEGVAQMFLGIIICAGWLSLLIHKKPYVSMWDNALAMTLAAHLMVTMVSGMALKLYALTPNQDEYQKNGFAAMLMIISVLSVIMGLFSIFAGMPCLRKFLEKQLARRSTKTNENSRVEMTKVVPMPTSLPPRLRNKQEE